MYLELSKLIFPNGTQLTNPDRGFVSRRAEFVTGSIYTLFCSYSFPYHVYFIENYLLSVRTHTYARELRVRVSQFGIRKGNIFILVFAIFNGLWTQMHWKKFWSCI